VGHPFSGESLKMVGSTNTGEFSSRITQLRMLQVEKAYELILFTFVGMTTMESCAQLEKALEPMDTTEVGITTVDKAVLENALSGRLVTVVGMETY